MKPTKTVSLDELRKMEKRGELHAARGEAEVLDLAEGFWNDAEVVLPVAKKAISMRVDPDILEFFKSQGNGHLTRMHAVLRAYVDAQLKRDGPRP